MDRVTFTVNDLLRTIKGHRCYLSVVANMSVDEESIFIRTILCIGFELTNEWTDVSDYDYIWEDDDYSVFDMHELATIVHSFISRKIYSSHMGYCDEYVLTVSDIYYVTEDHAIVVIDINKGD